MHYHVSEIRVLAKKKKVSYLLGVTRLAGNASVVHRTICCCVSLTRFIDKKRRPQMLKDGKESRENEDVVRR